MNEKQDTDIGKRSPQALIPDLPDPLMNEHLVRFIYKTKEKGFEETFEWVFKGEGTFNIVVDN